MSDVVIRGMEMPKDGRKHTALLQFLEDGACRCVVEYSQSYDARSVKVFEVVPLPEGHGDLIDRDNVLLDIDCTGTNKFGMLDEDIRAFLRRYKPIVPAEGGEADGN